MRSVFLRSTLLVVATSLMMVIAPVLAALLVFSTRTPDERIVGNTLSGSLLAVSATGGFLALSVLAGLIGMLVARRQAATLTAPLTALASQAEKLGAGHTATTPLATGIREVDRISEVLAASSMDISRALSAERDFAADASHQLRTPLAALLLRLDEIAATDDPEVVREEAETAIAQVERLAGVVDELMGRTKRRPAETSVVSLDSVIAALQREWQPALTQARRSMRVHGERGLQVLIPRPALSQILSTLIENSLAHGRGTVSVHARRSGPTVVVEVSDEGSGVAPGIAARIFERSVSSSGTGLGLALARDLAESNYGRLELLRADKALFGLFLSEASSSSLAKTNLR